MTFYPYPWIHRPCGYLFIDREARSLSVALCTCRKFGVYMTTEAISRPLWEAHVQAQQAVPNPTI